ncbi:uncharacterized protein LOC142318874 [Lycorma delicatula]|uniref:uncharacterized protein LOC142318874 n=1 Tax=Lycorma delicatula TaxID=130591 RepID=UPI003F5174B2
MCDQTEVLYTPGDIVWVKLGPVWWPGQVYDYNKLPEEITSNLRKKPIAVVKFFQEDSYEYVKNLNSIYHYNCRRKHEFIKKGLDMCRSNNRDVPSNMTMFPNDIVTAEHLTNGNPDILNDEEFAPEEKEDYSEIFGKKTPRKGKLDSVKKDLPSWRLKPLSELSAKGGRRSLPTPSIRRPITHPRFITKALEGRSDHEVRIRKQTGFPDECRESENIKQYNCHLCGFSSSRINVIVLHNKSHRAGYADAYLPPQQLSAKGRKIKSERKSVYGSEKRQRISDISKTDEPPMKRKNVKPSVELMPDHGNECGDKTKITTDSPNKTSTALKKPIFGKKKSAKYKAEKLAREKQQNDAFRETLLKDWDDEDDGEEDKDASKEKDSSLDSSLNLSDKKDNSVSKPKEISCFDFDDSEDGLNIGETVMKFGRKIPRVLGEKPKKSMLEQSPLKTDITENRKQGESIEDVTGKNDLPEILSSEEIAKEQAFLNEKACQESKEKHCEDLDSAFKSLLDETAVPVIPDAPTHVEVRRKNVGSESSTHSQLDDDGGGSGGSQIKEEDILEQKDHKKNCEDASDRIETNQLKNKDKVSVHCISDASEDKEISYVNSEHFLVKTSEEVATSSSDVKWEEDSSLNENNVAISKDLSMCSVKKNTKTVSVECEHGGSEVLSEEKAEFECAENVPTSLSSVSSGLIANNMDLKRGVPLCSVDGTESVTVAVSEVENILTEDSNTTCKAVESQSTSNITENQSCNLPKVNNFQEMEFDINSMPVIISDDMIQGQQNTIVMTSNKIDSLPMTELTGEKSLNTTPENKVITVKSIPVTKQLHIDAGVSGKLPVVVEQSSSVPQLTTCGIDSKLSPRKVLLSPTKSVPTSHSPQIATIKVQPSVAPATNKLTVPGGIIAQKSAGSTSQVLILKSTTSHGQQGKSALQKISSTSQMIQQGGKVLILTNPQGATGQNKVLSTLTTQKNFTSGKLTGTRILTTKGTVLTSGTQAVISKGNLLSGSSKTVTTKSGQKILINKGGVISQTPKSVIINKSGVLTSVNSPTVISNKGSLITQNILANNAESPANVPINSSQITASNKGSTTILSTTSLSGNKGMILTPVSSSRVTPLNSNQKLRLITSKANPTAAAVATSSNSGTKLMIQSSQSRMILPSSSLPKNPQLKLVGNLKSPGNTSTILIQTSQGVIATTPLSANQIGNKSKQLPKSSLPAVISSSLAPKTTTIQVAQATPQSQSKLLVQKVKPSGPNILQKTHKKPNQRSNKKTVTGQLIATSVPAVQNIQSTHNPVTVSPLASTAQDTLILPSTAGLPVIGQSNVQGSQLDPSNQTALVYLTVDESGNYRPIEPPPVVNYEGAAADSQTLYIDPGTADLDNIFLAIDDSGNVVNITHPVQNTFTTESPETPPPSQDILAKALANTQVLQQETIATENSLSSSVESPVLGGCMFVEPQSQYPQPTLSHNVLETSLTLNQPIMTPLEVPSAVSPRSLDQISSLQTSFLNDSSVLTASTSPNKEKKSIIHPSMPLLTEEPDCSASGIVDGKNETVFFTQVGVDGSHAVLTPVTSGSQLAFQLSLDENNVIVSSTPGISSLGVISSSSIPQSSLNYISSSESQNAADVGNHKSLISINNPPPSSAVFTNISEQNDIMDSFQLTDKLLIDDKIVVSDNGTMRSVANETLVLGIPGQGSSESSVIFKTKDETQHKNEIGKNVSSCIVSDDSSAENVQTVVEAHTEPSTVSSETISSNDMLVTSHELSESKLTDTYSEMATIQIQNSDHAVSINTTASSSIESKQAISKTDDVIDTNEKTFTPVTNTLTAGMTISSGNKVTESGKRHLEDIMRSENLDVNFESKKIKLDER